MDLGSEVFDLCMKPLEAAAIDRRRRELIPQAAGQVLEIGAGTGANLAYYDFSLISELHLSDPELRNKLLKRAMDGAAHNGSHRKIHAHQIDAEEIPFPDAAFDSIVFTLVFCSVKQQLKALREVRRVLRPEGRVYFIEHVISVSPILRKGMNLLNRPWHFIAGGCNINRDTETAIRDAGFQIDDFQRSARGIVISGVAYLSSV